LSQRRDDWQASLGKGAAPVLANQSSLRRDKPGGGESNWSVLCAVLVTVAFSGPALGQGVPENEIGQARQFEEQIAGPFRQLYKAELHFMRTVCQPTKAEFEKIAADGEPELKATIKRFAKKMHRVVDDQEPNPRSLLTNMLVTPVQSTLSPAQAARYQKELDERALVRKRVWVLCGVRMMDRILVLTPAQRDELGKILEKSWKDSLNQYYVLLYGDHYFPAVPDAEILPVLTEDQKTVWRGVQKATQFGFHVGLLQSFGSIEDEVWEEDRPKKAARGDDKAAAKGKGAAKPFEKK
jgi:hypothetical protein